MSSITQEQQTARKNLTKSLEAELTLLSLREAQEIEAALDNMVVDGPVQLSAVKTSPVELHFDIDVVDEPVDETAIKERNLNIHR